MNHHETKSISLKTDINGYKRIQAAYKVIRKGIEQ